MRTILCLGLAILLAVRCNAADEEKPKIVLSAPPSPVRFMVCIPEEIRSVGSGGTNVIDRTCIVQSKVQKALLDAGYRVMNPDLNAGEEGTNTVHQVATGDLLKKAADAKIDYLIAGAATAIEPDNQDIMSFKSQRPAAQVSVQIIRISDREILAVEDASGSGAARTQKTGCLGALEEAGQGLSAQLINRLSLIAR